MRLELTGRHVTITPAIRKLVDLQLTHVRRILNDSIVSVQIVLTKEKARVHCDAAVHARGEKFLHAEGAGRDVATALAQAVGKVDRQARKVKTKWTDGHRHAASLRKIAAPLPPEVVEPQVRIIRGRKYPVKPMTMEEGAAAVIKSQDAFLVFRNSENDEITVLFRRPDGNLGLIEPEA